MQPMTCSGTFTLWIPDTQVELLSKLGQKQFGTQRPRAKLGTVTRPQSYPHTYQYCYRQNWEMYCHPPFTHLSLLMVLERDSDPLDTLRAGECFGPEL